MGVVVYLVGKCFGQKVLRVYTPVASTRLLTLESLKDNNTLWLAAPVAWDCLV